jgi:hypothetical protein
MIATKYPYPALKKDQSDVVEGTRPVRHTLTCQQHCPLTLLFQAMASEPSVDLSIRKLGGIAQFERVARALGWTPPGGGSHL